MTTHHNNAQWRKSTYSGNGGNCVEVAFSDRGMVGVRDSKNPAGPTLNFTPTEWSAFLTDIQNSEPDHA
jgi:hypothetical protein